MDTLQSCLRMPVIVADSVLDEVANHAVFLGYQVKRGEGWIDLVQGGNFSWHVRDFRSGLIISRVYRATEEGARSKDRMMTFANGLNRSASFLRVYVTEENRVILEAWHPNLYERESFGRFFMAINLEARELLMARKSEVGALLA